MPRKILTISDALSNPLRRIIVNLLLERPGMSMRQLARVLRMGAGNLAGHLLILERVGLVREERDGNRIRLYVNTEYLLNGGNGDGTLHLRRV